MKEATLLRSLIVALPAGLLVLGTGAMFVSHQRAKSAPSDPNEAIRLEAAALKRRAVDREGLARSVATLARRIGERHAGKPESLESAALWFESSVGPANLGYLVERHVFEAGGREARNLVAELPGRELRAEILVVGAHYDTAPGSAGADDNASGVAVLVALAAAFAGDPQKRTVRFAAFANGAPPHLQTETMGSLAYANRCRARGETVVAMLALDSLGRLGEGASLAFQGADDSRYFVDSAAGAFASASSLPARAGVASSPAAVARATDQWAFSKAGFPAVAAFVEPAPAAAAPGAPDLPESVDPETLAKIATGLERVLRTWANP